jgi:hypothetical protein
MFIGPDRSDAPLEIGVVNRSFASERGVKVRER